MRALLAIVVTMLSIAAPSQGQIPDGSSATPEDWALSHLRKGEVADFGLKCGKVIHPPAHDPCREVSPAFIEAAMANSSDTSALSHSGVQFDGAIITGSIDLSNARVSKNISIVGSRIDGGVSLARAQFDFGLSLEGSEVSGAIDASGTRIGRDFRLDSTTAQELNLIGAAIDGFAHFQNLNVSPGKITLNSARIHDDLVMQAVTVPAGIEAHAMVVGGNFDMREQQTKPKIDASDSTIGVDLWLSGALGDVTLDSVHVGSTLHMEQGKNTFGYVDLRNARIDHTWGVVGSISSLNGHGVHVVQDASIDNTRVSGQLDLRNAHFEGNLSASGSTVYNQLVASGLHVDGTLEIINSAIYGVPPLDLSHAHIGEDLILMGTQMLPSPPSSKGSPGPRAKQPVKLRFARIGADFDLSGATLSGLDLTGATVEAEFRLISEDGRQKTSWQAEPPPRARGGHLEPHVRTPGTPA